MRSAEVWATVELRTGRIRPMVVTIPEFASILDISRITAYRMATLPPDEGGVQVVQLLGTKRIPVAEIFRLLHVEDGVADAVGGLSNQISAP